MTALVRLARAREATTGLLRQAGVASRRDGRAAHLVLNRPASLNALSHDMVSTLLATLEDLAGDHGVETVVLSGAGSRGLCAGGDLVFLRDDARTGAGRAMPYWRDLYALAGLVAAFPKPIVALMDGYVLGGGLGVSGRAAVRVVTDRSVVGMPETRIGFFPDTGGLHLLSRLPGEIGTYLALCAQTLGASDALAAGLADHYVPSADLDLLVDRLAVLPVSDAIASAACPPPGPTRMAGASWIEECFGGADPVVIRDRLLRHPDPAAREAGAVLLTRSPSAVAVTLHGLRTAATTDLTEDLDLELRLAARLRGSHDFSEGIRARLVDKGGAPRWSPAQLEDVDQDWVRDLFG